MAGDGDRVADHAVHTVTVDGAVVWGVEGTDRPYTLACASCGATAGWRLRVQEPVHIEGERAWAVCAAGHEQTHPLVYPAMVWVLLEWLRRPVAQRPPLAEALADWEPHRGRLFGADHGRIYPRIVWEPMSAGPGRYWRRAHPHLLAASWPAGPPDGDAAASHSRGDGGRLTPV